MAAVLEAYREIHQFGRWNHIQVDQVVLFGPEIDPAEPVRLFLVCEVSSTLSNVLSPSMNVPPRRINGHGSPD